MVSKGATAYIRLDIERALTRRRSHSAFARIVNVGGGERETLNIAMPAREKHRARPASLALEVAASRLAGPASSQPAGAGWLTPGRE